MKEKDKKIIYDNKNNQEEENKKNNYNGGDSSGDTYESKKWGNDKKGEKNKSRNGSGIARFFEFGT